MRVYIIDEEGSDLNNLRAWLSEREDITGVVSFQEQSLLMEAVNNIPPDWCFIRLGRADIPGFKLAEMVRQVNMEAKVVFISQVRDYALYAFEVGAYGYLLSPVEEEKLKEVFLRKV